MGYNGITHSLWEYLTCHAYLWNMLISWWEIPLYPAHQGHSTLYKAFWLAKQIKIVVPYSISPSQSCWNGFDQCVIMGRLTLVIRRKSSLVIILQKSNLVIILQKSSLAIILQTSSLVIILQKSGLVIWTVVTTTMPKGGFQEEYGRQALAVGSYSEE